MLVLINGTSSSGKSTLLDELKKLRPDAVVFKIDDWFPEEVESKAIALGWHRDSDVEPWLYLREHLCQKTGQVFFDSEIRRELFKSTETFYRAAIESASKNALVVIDTVLEHEEAYVEFESYFRELPVKRVLLYCPLDVLLKRVETRNKGEHDEKRTAFQSFEQFPAMYTASCNPNSQHVDTVDTHVLRKALQSAIQDLVEQGIPEAYLERLRQFKEEFNALFKLDEKAQIELFARHHYDLILNSADSTPHDLALKMDVLNEA